jgi:hypothetical protein
VLLREHAGGQTLRAVARQHRHDRLPPYWPVVQFGRHFVDRGTHEAAPRINRPLMCVQARECWQQRRMNVEQSSGVGQINSAVGQLNQTTQQNASSSEELAATSEEMSSQAEQLQQTMTFFKV